MWATSDGPKIEDFGITEDDLESAPGLFVAGHRREILAFAYLAAAAVLFLVMLEMGSSWAAAVFFTVIVMAAGSVIVVPLIVAALCAGERAEERWLCRRFPVLRACFAYRRALAEHADRPRPVTALHPNSPDDWATLSHRAYAAEIGWLLERVDTASVFSCDREATGVDFKVEWPNRRVVLRCEIGSGAISAGVGRELAAALVDSDADAAVIVSTSAPDPTLDAYTEKRAIVVVPPWDLEASIAALGSGGPE